MSVMVTREVTKKIEPILRKHGVSFAGVLGSRARGTERPGSDLDLLVTFNTPQGLFELVGLERDLSQMLNVDVDVVTEGALSPLIRPEIFKDLQPLYGKR